MSTAEMQKAVFLARKIVDGSIDPIEGCRQMVSLRVQQEIRDDQDFVTIRGFESETDEFPVGEARKHYDSEYLKKLDLKLKWYLDQMMPNLIEACQNIIKKYGGDKVLRGQEI